MHEIRIQNIEQKKVQRDETPDISVENPNVGKTTAAHRLQKIALYVRDTIAQKTQRQQPLVFFLATRSGGYTVEATTSLSHTLSLSHALYNLFTIMQQPQ